MSTLPNDFITPERYLDLERKAEIKHEYYNGEMSAMSGAKEPHAIIVGNLMATLRLQLRPRGCRAYSNDLRVRVSATGLYTYPDIVVACGERQFLDDELDTLLNPSVIFEVLSPSTERYDRGRKFDHYAAIDALRHYVLVASDRISVEVFTRQPDGSWNLRKSLRIEDIADLEAVGRRLPLAEVYDDVEFSQAPIR